TSAVEFREPHIGVVGDAGKRCGFILERLHVWRETHSFVFSPLRIVAAADQLIQGRGMTIGGIEISEFVVDKAKWIDTSVGLVLHTAAIGTKADGVSGDQVNRIPISASDRRHIGKPMT